MTPNPACVRPQDTLAKAKELMTAGGFRRLPVVKGDNKLVGMISEHNVRQHLGYLAETEVNAAMAFETGYRYLNSKLRSPPQSLCCKTRSAGFR